MHGLIMIFGQIMPAFVEPNWLIPMQVGAPDMALPRMNNLILVTAAAFTILLSTAFMKGMPGLVGLLRLYQQTIQI